MNIPSTHFVVGATTLSGVVFALPRRLLRQIVIAAFSAGFLATQIPNKTSAVGLGIFLLSGFCAGELIRLQQNARLKGLICTCYVAALVITFAFLKEYQFLYLFIRPGSIARWVSIVGLSYMLFRQIHYVVDLAQGQIESTSLWTYLNYQLNAFGLLAGPIMRYQPFAEDWNLSRSLLTDTHQQLKTVARLMIGVLKVTVVGRLAMEVYTAGCQSPIVGNNLHDWGRLAMMFYGFPVYLFFNFSGYCDVVIAAAAMVGIAMPENFNQPYLARNVIDFWARFHMTLTSWIRDYIFTPLYKAGVERQIMPPQRLGYVCFFIALLLAGIWHGSSWNFVVFGFLHGCGVSVNKMWEDRIIKKSGRPRFREYMKSPRVRFISIFFTFHFVCFTLLFFSPDLKGRVNFLCHFASGMDLFAMGQP
jgi:D-alanyl-lipoteichoic acid acyltransferase DltB (MBOAT superfamily)